MPINRVNQPIHIMQTPSISPTKPSHKAGIGLLLGLACGTGIAWLAGASSIIGAGPGMFAGAVIGACIDKELPVRSRIALAGFAVALIMAALVGATM
ncbi:hypothetical protein RCH14_001319 [Massilia sp. MP_M2]|uniref:hypothetical protein n=1 Tax=Massilia sp. MP_M2 TaxID=3071713 RepID=UPI00319E9485